ncbi:MAG: ATP-binding protein [Myxococcota bacterium]
MTSLRTRVAWLFVLAAVLPVLLTALVWTVVTEWGTTEDAEQVALVTAALERQELQGQAAVDTLCRNDLVVDRLLESESTGSPVELDFRRLFDAKARSAGLQAIWVLDAHSGAVLVRGSQTPLRAEGSPSLVSQARSAEGPFLLALDEAPPEFLGYACTIERAGSAVTLVGAHRMSKLLAWAPERVALREAPRPGETPLQELANSEGEANFLVWRSRQSNTPPLWIWLLAVGGVSIGLALMSGSYLTRWLESGVEELTVAATRVGSGDLATTLREGEPGPFQATATAFNRMTRDLRSAQEQLRQTERIAAWQDMAKRLAHELKNPLSPIRLSIETLRKARSRSHEEFDALFDETTSTILQEVERLRSIIDEFARFARLPSPTLRETNLSDIASQVVQLYAEGPVLVSASLPDHPVVAWVDSDQITQVLHNLIQNARDAARQAHPASGGRVELTLEERSTQVQVRVEDNGPGIPDELQTVIFEPYHTDKREGSGLGLAISSRIISEHGGHIEVRSRAGQTVFTVTVPRRRTATG